MSAATQTHLFTYMVRPVGCWADTYGNGKFEFILFISSSGFNNGYPTFQHVIWLKPSS